MVSLISCASPGPIAADPSIQLLELSSLPLPDSTGVATVDVRDQLKIDVLGFADLGRELRIDASGSFQFPLIGMVRAEGRTPYEISQDIASRLRGPFVKNPEVTVDLVEQSAQLFTMGGEVNSPGRYPILKPMTLMEAVATSGGTTDTASTGEVLIFRTVSGQRYIGAYDLSAIQRGNYQDPFVFPGDIVQVGESPSLRRIRTIATITPLVTAPLILLERVFR